MSTEHRAQSTEASYTYKLLVLTSSILFLTACGGSSSSSPTPQTKTFKVSANVASGEGTVTPTQQSIEQGKTTTLNLSPKDGYQIASATGCNGTLKNNVYTTGAINADCQVQVSFEEKIATINTLEAKVEVKQEVQLLSADVTQNLAIAGNKLTFVGNPKLKVGDVFVANEIAYKVEAIGGSASATEIITSEPSLNDIYDEIEISGEFNDYAEFIPVTDNTPIVQARSANARVITAASNSTSTTERFELLSKSNKNGFSVSKYTVEIEKGVLKTTGTIDTGLIVKADKWKVLSGEGSANIDMYIEPTIEIAFTKSQSVFDQAAQDNGVCMGIGGNSAALKNKRAEKLGPGRYLLGYMQFPVTTPIPVRIRVPVCVAVNAEANAEFKLLEFTGKATIKTGLGKSSTISSTNNLKLNVPNKNATVPDGEPVTDASTSTTVLKKTVGIKGLVSFPEISVEIVDASGYIAGVGVMVSPIAEASLTGTVPALTVNTDFNKLSVGDPELCLTLEGKGTLRGKGFVDFFWTKGTPLQVKHSHEFFKETKKWGLCKEENNHVSEDVSLSAVTCSFKSYEEKVTSLSYPDGSSETIVTPAHDIYSYDISGSLILNQVIEKIGDFDFRFYRYPIGYTVTPIAIGADGETCRDAAGDAWNTGKHSEIPFILQEHPLPPLNTQWYIKGTLGNPIALFSRSCKSPSVFQGLRIEYAGNDKPTGGKDSIIVNIPCPKKE